MNKPNFTGNSIFKGNIVALVTPMFDDGSIDYDSLCRLIDWHIASGSHGLVIMGTTGESSLVSKKELINVVMVSIEHANKRIPIIAGCGAASTFEVIDLVKQLNSLKPDGYLCVTPYYVKPSQEGLIIHYKMVADVCEAPLILYNVPSRTACNLSDESIIQLSKHDNIVGLKDAVGDITRAKKLFTQIPNDFIFLSGDDETAFEYVTKGGHGVISVTGNLAPALMSQWCNLLLQQKVSIEDKYQAQEIFNQLMPLHKKLFIEANPISVKWALSQLEKIPAGIRLPLTQPSPSSKKEITEAMYQSNLFQAME